MFKDKLKVILSILLVSVLVCGFFSCSGGSDVNTENNGNNIVQDETSTGNDNENSSNKEENEEEVVEYTELQKKLLEMKGAWKYGNRIYVISEKGICNIMEGSVYDISDEQNLPYSLDSIKTVSDAISQYGNEICVIPHFVYDDETRELIESIYEKMTVKELIYKIIDNENSYGHCFSVDDICNTSVINSIAIYNMQDGKLCRLLVWLSDWDETKENLKRLGKDIPDEYYNLTGVYFCEEGYYVDGNYEDGTLSTTAHYARLLEPYVPHASGNNSGNGNNNGGGSGGSESGSFSGTLSGTYTLQEATASNQTSTFEFSSGTLKKSVGTVVTDYTYTLSGSTLKVTSSVGGYSVDYEFTLSGDSNTITAKAKGSATALATIFGVTSGDTATLKK